MFTKIYYFSSFKPLNTELNPTCHLLALLGAHHILHFSRIRVNEFKFFSNEHERVKSCFQY